MLSRRVGKRAGGKVRATLTPSPAPALRERGDLGGGIGIVDRCPRSIAPAPLLSSSPAALAWKEGWREGEGRPHPQPLSRTAGEG